MMRAVDAVMRAVAAVRRRVAELPPRVILVLGWLGLFIYGFPGMMSMDSIQQLQEARAGVYTDLHPALMARTWHLLEYLYGGPFPMFVIQITAFIPGLYLILKRALSPRKAAVATCLIALFPPVLAPMGVVWKDCPMVDGILLGTAGLLSERRAYRIAGLVGFVIATAVRYNAPTATLPLIVLLFTWFPTEPTWRSRIQRYAIATAAWVAVTVTAIGINTVLTDKPMYPWSSTLAVLDTAGTLAHLDEDLPDLELRELFRGTDIATDHDLHAAIRRQYHSVDFEPLITGEGHLWDVQIAGTEPTPKPRREAFGRMFWTTVTEHPGAYIEHRLALLSHVLAFDGFVFGAVMEHRFQFKDILEKELSLTANSSRLQIYVQRRILTLAKKTPLFCPWIYLTLSVILLAFCRRHRDIFAILLSGIGLIAGLLIVAPSPDYRYSHWMVLATCMAVVMLVARRAQSV